MNIAARRTLYWTPRILTVASAAFLALFALDVFDEAHGFWATAGALFMHLIPTWLVLGFLWISWRREWLGAVAFLGLAIAYVVMMWGRFPLATYLVISGPLVVMAALFFLNWIRRSDLRPVL